MLETFTVQLHHEDPHGNPSALGRLSLLYVMTRLVNTLEARTKLSRVDLEASVVDAFTQAFAPAPAAPDGLVKSLSPPLEPFLLGGLSPGLSLTIDEEGEPLQMEIMTHERAEELRTHFNRALKVVADDPTEFDNPLLLGPDDAP